MTTRADPAAEHCEAIPRAALRGHRADVGCASLASTTITDSHRVIRHVCRMHEARYARALACEEATAAILTAQIEREWRWTS